MTHELKILPKYFRSVLRGIKTFEIRKNDRNFQVGDRLILKEWENGEYTGNAIEKEVTYILDDDSGYVLDGHVVMGLNQERVDL